MAGIDHARRLPDPERSSQARAPLTLPELVKFTLLAAFLAMFADAAVAHAMLWGNDPYWTYWITDALLMATVFGVGTAWLGVGLKQGAALTVVHVLLLTTYYWTLSPIGLPAQPEWLDLERTWITGLPVHFGVYFLGYSLAVWLRERSRRVRLTAGSEAEALGPTATLALALAATVTILLGLLQMWIVGEFPGVTWFIVRIAIMTPLVLVWWAMAGADRVAAVSGGVMLGFLLSTYSHYLGPMGLPNPSLRLTAANPPPALVQWLPYREEFLVLLPAAMLLSIVAMLFASRWRRDMVAGERMPERAWSAPAIVVVVLALIGLGAVAYRHTGPEANRTTVSAVGPGSVERGAPFGGDLVPAAPATLTMTAENSNTHRTPLRPHDKVSIAATVAGADGTVYTIAAAQPTVEDPRGRHTTWAGVGFDVWSHGRSGIGSARLPPTHSDVAVFARGDVVSGGRTLAADVPVHVLTSTRPDSRLELHVGDPDVPVAGLPSGHLRVVWAEYTGGPTFAAKQARYAWGGGVLIALLGFPIILARRAASDDTA